MKSLKEIFFIYHQFDFNYINFISFINILFQEIKNYIIYLLEFQVTIYHFYKIYISSKDFLWYYEKNHISKKDHFIVIEIHRKIVEYMIIFDLYKFYKIISFYKSISQLKIIKNKLIYNFFKYNQYSTSKNDMLIYYYTH